MEAGGVGSDYCTECHDRIDDGKALERLNRLDLALHQIVGHGNITGEMAREIAAEALEIEKPK